VYVSIEAAKLEGERKPTMIQHNKYGWGCAGRFIFDGLRSRRHKIHWEISQVGFRASGSQEIDLTQNTNVDISIRADSAVELTLVDLSRNAISEAQVCLERMRTTDPVLPRGYPKLDCFMIEDNPAVRAVGYTDGQGRAAFGALPTGLYRIVWQRTKHGSPQSVELARVTLSEGEHRRLSAVLDREVIKGRSRGR
jgi:hypothetical protein